MLSCLTSFVSSISLAIFLGVDIILNRDKTFNNCMCCCKILIYKLNSAKRENIAKFNPYRSEHFEMKEHLTFRITKLSFQKLYWTFTVFVCLIVCLLSYCKHTIFSPLPLYLQKDF